MVIYTYGHEYPVSSVQESNDKYDCYICKDERDGGFCRILSIKDRTKFPELVSWLSSTVDPEVFTDYIEHFNFEGNLCIVMKYSQGQTLTDKLEMEALPLMERLELCRKILERVVLQDIPEYFLYRCLDMKQIIVAPDLSVCFNYPIEDITGDRLGDPMTKAEKLLKTLFAYEIERKVPDELMEFFAKLPEMLEGSIIDLYSRYYMMMSKLVNKESEAEEPKSFWYKLWARIKKIWKVLKRIVMFLLLAAAVTYLIFTINTSGSSKKKGANFDKIGIVVIDKNR